MRDRAHPHSVLPADQFTHGGDQLAVRAVVERAKRGNQLLAEAEIYAVVNQRETKTGS